MSGSCSGTKESIPQFVEPRITRITRIKKAKSFCLFIRVIRVIRGSTNYGLLLLLPLIQVRRQRFAPGSQRRQAQGVVGPRSQHAVARPSSRGAELAAG